MTQDEVPALRLRRLIQTATMGTGIKRLRAAQALLWHLADLLSRVGLSSSSSEFDVLLAAHFEGIFRWAAMEDETGHYRSLGKKARAPKPGRWVKRRVSKIGDRRAAEMLKKKRFDHAWVQLGDQDAELDAYPYNQGDLRPTWPSLRVPFARLFVWSEGPNHPLEDDKVVTPTRQNPKGDDDATKQRKREAWLRNEKRKAVGAADASAPPVRVRRLPKGRPGPEIVARLGLTIPSGQRGPGKRNKKP